MTPKAATLKKLAKELTVWSEAKSDKEIKAMVKALTENFYKKGHWRDLRELVRLLERQAEDKNGVVRVTLTSAFPPASSLKEKIFKKLGIKKFKLTEITDKNLIGGFEARFNDQVVNVSLKNQLQNLLNI